MSDTKIPLKIMAFVGLAGAGKSSAVDYLTEEKKLPRIYFGGVIYDEMARRGIERTAASEQAFREAWRAEEGKEVVVKKVIEQIHGLAGAGQRHILLDGLYSWTEYKALKSAFPGELTVVAIVAPRRTRHTRLANRPERPYTGEEATARDWSQIENLEQGGPIAIADHFIHNDSGLDVLHEKIDHFLDETKFFQ